MNNKLKEISEKRGNSFETYNYKNIKSKFDIQKRDQAKSLDE